MEILKIEKSKKMLKSFLKACIKISKENNKNFIPPAIKLELEKIMHEESTEQINNAEYFMVFDNKKVVACFAIMIDDYLNQKLNKNICKVFYFNCIDDATLFKQILDYIKSYAKDLECKSIDISRSINFCQYNRGFLKSYDESIDVEDFTDSYYLEYFKQNGFDEKAENKKYNIQLNNLPYESYKLLSEKAQLRFKYKVERTHLNKSNISSVAEKITNLIHQCYDSKWKVSQASNIDIEFELKKLLKLSDFIYISFAYSGLRPIGFLLAYSPYIENTKSYCYSHCPYLKIKHLLSKASNIVEAKMIFVVPDFQHKAVDISMICNTYEAIKKDNIENVLLNTITWMSDPFIDKMDKFGAKQVCSYVQYEYNL